MTNTLITNTEALAKINSLINLPILEVNRTYGYFLVLTTSAGAIVIEAPWTLFYQGKSFLNIKTENYDLLQSKANKLLNEKITEIKFDTKNNASTITFTNDHILEIYHEDENSIWYVKLADEKTLIEYRSDYKFYVSN